MYRWFVISVFLVFCTLAGFSQIKLPFVKAQQIEYFNELEKISKAGYKTCEIYVYVISDGNVTADKNLDRIKQFYPDGRIREIEFLDTKGRVESIDIYKYYPNKLPQSIGTFLPSGKELHREVYRYDTQGHLSEMVEYDEHGYILSKIVVEIDTSLKKAGVRKYTSPEDIAWFKCFYFDDLKTGRLIQKEDYSESEELLNRRIIEYENNNLHTETVMKTDSTIIYQLAYIYDVNGDNSLVNLIEPNDRKLELIRYDYDKFHLVTGIFEKDRNSKIVQMIKNEYH